MTSLLFRSARPTLLRVSALTPRPAIATRLVSVPVRHLADDATGWNTPISQPLKSAASEVAADVKHAASSVKEGVKLKARQMQSSDAVDEAKQKANELGVKAKRVVDRASAKLGDMIDPAGAARFHTSAAPRVGNSISEDLKEDATRLKQKAQNRATQVGAEMKEQGQSLLHSAKKTARKVTSAVSGAVDNLSSDATSASEPVRQTTNSPQLSTSRRSGNVLGGDGGSALGETQSSVKKSLFDGPQTMPQGVGKRAVDEEGTPMETGAPRT